MILHGWAYLHTFLHHKTHHFFSLLKQKILVIYFMTTIILHTISPMTVSSAVFAVEVICIGLALFPPVFSSQKIRSVKYIQKSRLKIRLQPAFYTPIC